MPVKWPVRLLTRCRILWMAIRQVAVERTLCRLLGIDGVDVHAVPLPNILVDELKEKERVGRRNFILSG